MPLPQSIFLITLTVLSMGLRPAHGVQQSWSNRYHGGGTDTAASLALDGAGNSYVLGETVQTATGSDFVTLKYGPDGSQLWMAKYAGPNNDLPQALTLDSSGNVYVTGASPGAGSGFDFLTLKYDQAGKEIWVKRFNSPGNSADYPVGIAVDSGGNVLVAGYAIGAASGYDFLIVKYDGNGNQLWTATYTSRGQAEDFPVAMALDSAGNVYVTGFSVTPAGDADYTTVKYATDGRQLWVASYDGPAHADDYPAGIQLDGAGNLYVAGTSAGLGTNDDFATLKYDSSGNQLWAARFNGALNSSDFANALAVGPGGKIYVTGTLVQGLAEDYLTVAYDPQGNKLWDSSFNGPGNGADSAHAIALDFSENVYVAGVSSASAANDDIVLIKYDNGGNQLWVTRYDGPAQGRDLPKALRVDGGANVFVTGNSARGPNDEDIVTIKFFQSQTAGLPVIVKSPLSQIVLAGSEVVFSVGASGAEPLNYQWRFNGVDLAGANGESFRIPAVRPEDAGAYSVVVRNSGGEVSSATANLRVDRPVVITAQPQSQSIVAGSTLDLTVNVSGSDPLSYRWLFDDVPLPGQTGPTLLIPNAGLDNQGQYRVEVRNPVNTVSSEPARIFVLQPVKIITQPRSQAVAAGGVLRLAVEAEGTEPITYQWFNGANPIPGQIGPTLTIPNIQAAAAGNYTVVLSNPANITTSGEAVVTVLLPPTLTLQPQNQSVNPGANVVFSVQATGSPPLSYQWQYNGVNLPGESSPSLVIAAVEPGDSGNYSVVVANAVDAVNSNNAELRVALPSLVLADNFADRGNATAAQFTGRGQNLAATKEAGEPNHAGKAGGKSVWYSWTAPASGIVNFNTAGSAIDTLLAVYTGTAVNALSLVAGDDDSGPFLTSTVTFNAVIGTQYQIAVDGLGAAAGNIVLSWNLVTTPDQVPVITQHPQNQTVAPGANATFTVGVQPQNNLRFQWFFEGAALPNETNPTLIVPGAQASSVGGYRVEVRNNTQVAVSETAFLELGSAPGVVSEDKFEDIFSAEIPQPARQESSRPRRSAFASVSAGSLGTQVMDNLGASTQQGEPNHGGVIGGSSRWFGLAAQADGVMIVDTIGSTIDTTLAVYRGNNLLNLTLVASDNNGAPDGIRSKVKFDAVRGVNYSVAVDGVRGAQGRITLNWKLGTIPTVTQAPSNQSVSAGSTVTFNVAASGAPAAEFQWQLNGTDIPGANASTFQLTNVQAGDAGVYRARARNFAGSAASAGATLTINTPIAIIEQPQGAVVTAGAGAAFSVAATGSGLLRYQWRFNGIDLPAATNSALNLANVQPANAGTYAVIVSNVVGTVASSNAALTVNVRPAISVQPQSQVVEPGSQATLLVTATGTGPLTFQWRFNGVNMPGATNSVLDVTNASQANAGAYSVVVQSPFGAVTSEDAFLSLVGSGLQLGTGAFSNGLFSFPVSGLAGRSVVIQSSTNLVSWNSLATNTLPAGPLQFTDSTSPTNSLRFYRALLLP